MDQYDVVENPQHYASGSIECIDAMKEVLGPEKFEGFLMGNVFKYVWRHDKKNGLEDVKKARWYLNKYIETKEAENA